MLLSLLIDTAPRIIRWGHGRKRTGLGSADEKWTPTAATSAARVFLITRPHVVYLDKLNNDTLRNSTLGDTWYTVCENFTFPLGLCPCQPRQRTEATCVMESINLCWRRDVKGHYCLRDSRFRKNMDAHRALDTIVPPAQAPLA